MKLICPNSYCIISISKAVFNEMKNCPVCQTLLIEDIDLNELSIENTDLISSLPYVIAYPLKQTLLEKHPWTKINLLKDTFLNYLKYLGLLVASEFFNSEIKNKKIVLIFEQTISEPSFGGWNHFIRECLKFLQESSHSFFCKELPTYYEEIETGNNRKLFKGEIQYFDTFGDVQIKKQSGVTGIGMLINFRNRYLGHGLTLDRIDSENVWKEFYPILNGLLKKMNFSSKYQMFKIDKDSIWCLHSDEIFRSKNDFTISQEITVWLSDNKNNVLPMVPFYVVPSELSNVENEKAQVLLYESYTGKTIKFFSPEGVIRETSGKILEKLNLLLSTKSKETPINEENITDEYLCNRIKEESKIAIDGYVKDKIILPGIYVHRNEIETKLLGWIESKTSIFFIAAENGFGKTNLLNEIYNQYISLNLNVLFIRVSKQLKDNLYEELISILNIETSSEISKIFSSFGSKDKPTFIFIDGINDSNNPELYWDEIKSIAHKLPNGNLKWIVSCSAKSNSDLNRFTILKKDLDILYNEENTDYNYFHWLSEFKNSELEKAWNLYIQSSSKKYKPGFSIEELVYQDRALSDLLRKPIVLRLFLEMYSGEKKLPKSKNAVWQGWFNSLSNNEHQFLKLLIELFFQKGVNDLIWDEVIKHKNISEYMDLYNIQSPFQKLKNRGWIFVHRKNMNQHIYFKIEECLFYLIDILLKPKYIDTLKIDGFLLYKLNNDGLKITIEELFKCADDTIHKKQQIWVSLLKLDSELTHKQLNHFRASFMQEVMIYNPLNTKESLLFGVKALSVLDKNEALLIKNKINTTSKSIQEDADLLFHLGYFEFQCCEYDLAIEYFDKYLFIKVETFGKEDINTIEAYEFLGHISESRGDYDKSEEYYQRCLKIQIVYYGIENLDIARTKSKLGYIFHIKGENEKAIKFYDESLEISLDIFGKENLAVVESLNNVGKIFNEKGEFDKSLFYFEKSLSIQLKLLNPEHNDLSDSYKNIGLIWKSKGNYEKSLQYLKKSLTIGLKIFGENHPNLAKLYNNIGDVLICKNEYSKALQYKVQSAEIYNNVYGFEHYLTEKLILNVKRLAKELGTENNLSEWMNKIDK